MFGSITCLSYVAFSSNPENRYISLTVEPLFVRYRVLMTFSFFSSYAYNYAQNGIYKESVMYKYVSIRSSLILAHLLL